MANKHPLGRSFSLFPGGGARRKATNNTRESGGSESELMRQKVILQSKIPKPPPLATMLDEIVYQKPFSEVNKDILRLIRRVSIVIRRPEKPEETIIVAEEEIPKKFEKMKEHPKEGVYIVMRLMKHLIEYFETEAQAKKLIGKMEDLYDRWDNGDENVEFEVMELLDVTGGDKTKTALTLRCIHQSIAISGQLHIKSRVCPYMTKDVHGSNGWLVSILLSHQPHPFVRICHTRRESSIEPSSQAKNHWEVEFKVFVTFDHRMRELTGAKLEITDLVLSDGMDYPLEKYLKECFRDGKLVVC